MIHIPIPNPIPSALLNGLVEEKKSEHRKPARFSHDHGMFRWNFSRENQPIDLRRYTMDSHPDEVSVSTQASTRATKLAEERVRLVGPPKNDSVQLGVTELQFHDGLWYL